MNIEDPNIEDPGLKAGISPNLMKPANPRIENKKDIWEEHCYEG